MSSDSINIETAVPADWPGVKQLLTAAGLPLDGLAEHFEQTLVARDGEKLVGCAALELYGDEALLRSVAVAADYRGQGMGEQITQAALNLARQRGVHEVYLLTETAADFFPRFGFEAVNRSDVTTAVSHSVEFTTCCPDSAQTMRLNLLSE